MSDGKRKCVHYLRYYRVNGKWVFDRNVSPRIMARMREHHMMNGKPTTIQYRKVMH